LQTTSQPCSDSKGPYRAAADLLQGGPEALARRLQRSHQDEGGPRIGDISPEAQKLMTGVFIRMKSIYGHLWSSNFPDDRTLRIAQLEWCAAFQSQGFTDRDVGAALDHCRDSEPKMPNLPQFVGIAVHHRQKKRDRQRRERLGLPQIETEEQLAIRTAEAKAAAKIRAEEGLPHIQALRALLG